MTEIAAAGSTQTISGKGNELRSSHFKLGHIKPNFKSEYNQEFTKKQVDLHNNLKQNTLNMRDQHYKFGDYASKNLYLTSNNVNYQTIQNYEISRLSEEKKADLSNHHFTLGQYAPKFTSTAQREYIQRDIKQNIKAEQEEQRNKMRKHNFQIGENNKTNYSSVYVQDFKQNYDPSLLIQGLNKDQIQQQVTDLRKSHILLGQNQQQLTSTAQIAYNKKENLMNDNQVTNNQIRQTHFELGQDKPDYFTTNSQFYVEQQPAVQKENTNQLVNDLRATHFILGNEPNNYQSLTAASYTKIDQLSKSKPVELGLSKNHFQIGGEPTKDQYLTVYNSFLKKYDNQKLQSPQMQVQDNKNNFILGKQQNNFESEAKSNYKNFGKVEINQIDPAVKKDLKSSHFKFNDVKSNQFKTITMLDYGNKADASRDLNKNLDQQKFQQQLRNSSFLLGNEKLNYVTSKQEAYKSLSLEKKSPDLKQESNLRGHHFNIGNGEGDYRSAYKTEFGWS